MNTATAVRLGIVTSAAATVTLLPPVVVAEVVPPQSARVQPVSIAGTFERFYETLRTVESDLDRYTSLPAPDWDELDLTDVYVELDADLPPRNADQWRPIEVSLVWEEPARYSADRPQDA